MSECTENNLGDPNLPPCELPPDEIKEILERNWNQGNQQYVTQLINNLAAKGIYYRQYCPPGGKPRFERYE